MWFYIFKNWFLKLSLTVKIFLFCIVIFLLIAILFFAIKKVFLFFSSLNNQKNIFQKFQEIEMIEKKLKNNNKPVKVTIEQLLFLIRNKKNISKINFEEKIAIIDKEEKYQEENLNNDIKQNNIQFNLINELKEKEKIEKINQQIIQEIKDLDIKDDDNKIDKKEKNKKEDLLLIKNIRERKKIEKKEDNKINNKEINEKSINILEELNSTKETQEKKKSSYEEVIKKLVSEKFFNEALKKIVFNEQTLEVQLPVEFMEKKFSDYKNNPDLLRQMIHSSCKKELDHFNIEEKMIIFNLKNIKD